MAPQTAAVRQLLPEELLHDAKYQIGGQIAQGGMGAILNAREVAIRRDVAMKVMLDGSAPDDLRRFVEEAQITGQLEHPNIVPVHELSVDENDQVFYTMKLVRGVTLRAVFDLLAGGTRAPSALESHEDAVRKYPLPVLLTIFQKVCDALAFAHSRGVIHRDLKPENIMLGDYGEVLVMDWGLAKRVGGRRAVVAGEPGGTRSVVSHDQGGDGAPPSSVDDPAAGARTVAGTIMGTPQYMAPEQARGEIETLDARADIYALGAILYHALTLRPPIDATSLDDILEKVRAGEIIPPIERQPPPRPHRPPTPPPATPAHGLGAPVPPRAAPGAPSPPAIDLNAPTVLQTPGGTRAPSALSENPTGRRPQTFGRLRRPRGEQTRSERAFHHLPDGYVPESLNAVVLKAMALEPATRYQSVEELQADVAAYQNGFATRAENAWLGKQLILLIKRHKGAFTTAAAAWFIITALAVWFVIRITASERKATHHAVIAARNEQQARQNATLAQANEKRAVASEKEAVAEKENVRRALARSALALAEAAYREADGPAMQSALDQIPADLRDANWSYLLEQSDTSVGRIAHGSTFLRGVAPHPKQAGVFAVANQKRVMAIHVRTGARLLEFPIDLGPTTNSTPFVLAFSPDGERIAVGRSALSKDETKLGMAIHSARDGAKLLTWTSTPVTKLEFSPDGQHLLQSSNRWHQNLWDAARGTLVWTYDVAIPPGGQQHGAIMPNGKEVVVATDAGAFAVLSMADGKEMRRVGQGAGGAESFALRPDGLAVAWGRSDGRIISMDLRDGRLLFSARVHPAPVRHLAFTTDGERLISLAELRDGRQSIVISNAQTGVPLEALLGGTSVTKEIAIHPLSGELLVIGAVSRLWDISGAAPRWTLRSASGDRLKVSAGGFVDSDDLFLGPSKGFRTALLDLRDLSVLWKPDSQDWQPFDASGRIVALANSSMTARRVQVIRRDNDGFSTLSKFGVSASGLVALRVSPDGARLALATKGKGKSATVLAAASGESLVALDHKSLMEFVDLHWLPGGAQFLGIAIAAKPRGMESSEERIIVWDAASGRQVRSVGHPTALDCLVVAPDGKCFAAAGADKLVHVFDTATLAERQAFRAHDGPITALAWHPARPIVATGSADLTIKLWNLDTGRRLETLRGPTAAPRVLNFSPSGQRLACASEDRMVRIWEPKPLQNAVLDAPAADGWEDLLAKLKAEEVKANGNGWTLSGGVLVSPGGGHATVPMEGSFARSSYTVRMTVKSLNQKGYFATILPVGDQQVSFVLDGTPPGRGRVTSLWGVNGAPMEQTPDALREQQVKDAEPHELEITVRLSAKTAQIVATLDDRPLYEWSGPNASLRLWDGWKSPAQPNLHLSANSADWIVSAVKVKRLEAGK